MSASGFQPSRLRDGRLAPLATSRLPAWLWSTDATRIVWANPIGAAIFGAPTSAAIGSRKFDAGHPAAAQIARLATTLSRGASPRLERLRGFGAGVGRALTCACSHIVLSDDTAAILVVAVERAGPDLPVGERVARLLAGGQEPIAAFAPDGKLLAAAESAHAHLRGARSLAALGAQALAADALASGHAAGSSDGNQISIDRIGSEAATVLIASFGAPTAAAAELSPQPRSEPAAAAAPAPGSPSREPAPPPRSPEMPTERRHPLRFVWQMDEERRFTLGSDQFTALMGARTAAVIGRPWQEMAAALGLDPEGQVARAVATRDTWSGLIVFWPVDGSPERFAVELSGLPVFDRDRVFRGYRGFGVCRDVARVTALAARRHPAQDLPAQDLPAQDLPTQDLAPSDIAPPAAPPTGEQPARAAAPAAENVVPFPSAAAEPNAPALSPVERRAFRELSRKLAQRLTAAGIEHKGEQPVATPGDDDAAGTQAQLPDCVPDAQPICAITQWKKAEEELTQAKRQAEKASSAKSDFLARISHEIRTPLNAIIGFSEVMAEERFGPIGNERYREYLKDIHASGGHLLSLINDLLDLSKIEAGKLELTFTSVALNDLTQQCVAMMQPQANRARIIIRTSLPPALPHVIADAPSTRQIVLNLLSNSIRFTGAGGQVIVSTALNDNGEVVLRVRDTGVGMSEQDLVTALEPFRQLATSERTGSGGTGLGLPLTKALAEANRASFCIKSAPKTGTLVEIAFPASRVLAG